MSSKIIYEQQGVTDDEAEIVSLSKNDFERVNAGEIIAEIETSKATIEVEANSDGYLKYNVSLNEIVKVGDLIATIGESQEELNEQPKASRKDLAQENSKEKSISAKTLKIAKSLAISINTLKDQNIFTVEEINAYIEANAAEKTSNLNEILMAKFDIISPSKNKISEIDSLKIAQSKTLPCSCSIILEEFNIESFSIKNNLYFDNMFPVIAEICSQELKVFKNLNGFFHDRKKHLYEDINIGFTIDSNDYLQVPVVHNCEKYNKEEIQNIFFELLKSSVTEKITLAQISKPTFVISDLSSVGNCFFHTPLLAPYTSSILGLAIDQKASRLTLTLTYDHQMSAGKEALLFLEAIRLKLLIRSN